MAKTLGDMTASDLVESANEEVRGLADLARRLATGGAVTDPELLIGAYEGSIRARLTVAEMKLRDS